MLLDTRPLADRIAAVHRGGPPITAQNRYDATALLRDLLTTAEKHGVTIHDLDAVDDLPGVCIDLVLAKDTSR